MTGLRKEATLRGFNVIVVPEVATVIMNSGFIPYADVAHQFQKHILEVQHQFDRSFVSLAKATRTPTLIIFDRGLMDGKAYTTSEDQWSNLTQKIKAKDGAPIDEDYILKSYDMVVHLVTAADGAEKFYKHGFTTDDAGHDVYRAETPERARALDRNLKTVWSKHPNHVIVENTESGMKGKVQKVVDEVMSVCEHYHPQNNQRITKELRSRAHDLEHEIKYLQMRVEELEKARTSSTIHQLHQARNQ